MDIPALFLYFWAQLEMCVFTFLTFLTSRLTGGFRVL
jgi:hypothetical protein